MRSQVLGVLPSGHHTDLSNVWADSGWEISEFQPEQLKGSAIRNSLERLRAVTKGGRLAQQILDWVTSSRISALVSLDNSPEISEIWHHLEIPIFVVQHGVRATSVARRPIPISRNIHFLSWGTLQREDLEFGRTAIWPNSLHKVQPFCVEPVGSLRDSISAQHAKGDPEPNRSSGADICLISQFKGHAPRELHHWKSRQSAIETVAGWTGRLAADHNLKLVIAGYGDSDSACTQERQWLEKVVNCDFEFVSPRTITSTHRLTQSSRISVGVHSSALWEAFGRRRRILATNPIIDAPFTFPFDGMWSLVSEDYQDFRARITQILDLSHADYLEAVGLQPERAVVVKPDESVEFRIRRYIAKILDW